MSLVEIKKSIARAVSKVSGLHEDSVFNDIERSKFADISVKTAFRMKGDKSKNVRRIADALSSLDFVKDIKLSGPYVNIFLDRGIALDIISKILLLGDSYGSQPTNGEKVVLEHTSINPTGPVHIGRFRNPVIGDALRRILSFTGYDVETHYYVNDVGRQIALITMAFDEGIPVDRNLAVKWGEYVDKNDFQVFFRYVPAYRLLESDPEFKKRLDKFLYDAENGNETLLAKLKERGKFCMEGITETLTKCGFKYDYFDYESDLIASGKVKDAMDTVKKKLKVKKLDTGASAVDLGLGRDTIISRPDGTSVYIIRDLAYHIEKLKRGFCINVLGEDHKLEFKELKELVARIGLEPRMEAIHFSFVDFGGKKMSTRRGETIPVDVVLDEGKEKAMEVIKEKNPGLADKEGVAEKVSIGAIKYFLIHVDPMKKISFDWEEALRFEGDTGPYLQYTHARAMSILRKSGAKIDEQADVEVDDLEWGLVLRLAEFPEIVLRAGEMRKPNIIANYLYSLADEFNSFYHSEKVIGSDKERFRKALVASVARVLRNGLYLLGIDALERM